MSATPRRSNASRQPPTPLARATGQLTKVNIRPVPKTMVGRPRPKHPLNHGA